MHSSPLHQQSSCCIVSYYCNACPPTLYLQCTLIMDLLSSVNVAWNAITLVIQRVTPTIEKVTSLRKESHYLHPLERYLSRESCCLDPFVYPCLITIRGKVSTYHVSHLLEYHSSFNETNCCWRNPRGCSWCCCGLYCSNTSYCEYLYIRRTVSSQIRKCIH